MSKFKIGQRVCRTAYDAHGVVVKINGNSVAVALDKEYQHLGTSITGSDGKAYVGLHLNAEDWKPESQPHKIVITTDGTATLARLYDGDKVVKRAEAKCAPSDTYDFTTGANLAYDRLMRPDRLTATTPKPEPEKKPEPKEPVMLYCVKDYQSSHTIKKGHVYTLVRWAHALRGQHWRSQRIAERLFAQQSRLCKTPCPTCSPPGQSWRVGVCSRKRHGIWQDPLRDL
jgi:hypothetical protein